MIDSFRYSAFLSYSHADRRWARWLQRALEGFRVPADFRRSHGLVRRPLYPVFRDEDELPASADLSEKILDALAASRHLIVVCSPAAAASKWVNTEIRTFRALGGERRIFCLVVAGDPVARDCFPPALLQDGPEEPLAADARAGQSRSAARLRLAAGLLDVGFDALRRRDAQARRKRWLMGTGAGTLSSAGIVGLTVLIATAPPCADSASRLAGIWDDETKNAMQTGFLSSSVAIASDALQRTMAALDRYATTWVGTHREACEATRVRGEQSDRLLDLRMRCLDERRLDLAAVTTLLRTPDPALIEQSIELSATLPGLGRCSDPDALLAAWPLPDDADQRAEIEALRAPLAVARAEVATQHDVSVSLQAIAERAAELDYPPLQAEALLLHGWSSRLDGEVEFAEETLHRAAAAAARAGDTRTTVDAWLKIVNIQVEFRAALTDALRLIELADAHVARMDNARQLQATIAAARGNVHTRAQDLTAARDAYILALDLAADAPIMARAIHVQHLISALIDTGELDRARQLADALYPDLVATFGVGHPRVADLLWSMGRIAQRRRDYAMSRAYSERAIDVYRRMRGDDHPELALMYQGLAWDLKSLGEFDAARAALERTLSICAKHPSDVEFFIPAEAFNTLGDLLVSQGDDDAARTAFEQSIAAWEAHAGSAGVSAPLINLGMLENRAGNRQRALTLCERGLAIDDVRLGKSHPDLAWSLLCVADALIGLERVAVAQPVLGRADSVLRSSTGNPFLRADARYLHARILWLAGEGDEARRLAQSAHATLADADPSFDPRRREIAQWLESSR